MAKQVKKKSRLLVTTGDVDGIGLEVTAKALAQLGPQRDCQYVIWCSSTPNKRYISLLAQNFTLKVVNEFSDIQQMATSPRELILIHSNRPPVEWVIESIRACQSGFANGLITGPLSKTGIQNAGYSYIGHTDILKAELKAQKVFMGFMGDHCNVMLVTGHVALKEVSKHLTLPLLKDAIEIANSLRLRLPKSKAKQPLGILGLNPHAGENGLIGREELDIIIPAIQWARARSIPVEGPLVPDAAFSGTKFKKYSVILSPAHDLGLIPFKILHGYNSGFHITLGIPIIRTSVDHGTANDLFNKNRALAGSMIAAIKGATSLSNTQRRQS